MKEAPLIKQKLYNFCQTFVDDRLKVIQHKIDEIQAALTSETKSSAGDKHETGRAMLQLEREKIGKQLQEIQQSQQILNKVNYTSSLQKVGFGSLVLTTQENYFIAISAGKIEIDGAAYYAVSTGTPIAQVLLSKKENDQFIFRGKEIQISQIH